MHYSSRAAESEGQSEEDAPLEMKVLRQIKKSPEARGDVRVNSPL
jgi:hypothetical protein